MADALKALDGQRECYRLTGEVLVQRRVQDVLVELDAEMARATEAVRSLEREREANAQEAQRLMAKHGAVLEQMGRRAAEADADAEAEEGVAA